jgi:hypothetical protein
MTTTAIAALLAVANAVTTFPGDIPETPNSRRTHVVTWREPDAVHDFHRLLLQDRRAGTSRELHRFGRWATIVWSPDGRRIAVTDGVGSDSSETWLYDVASGAEPTNVGVLALAKVGRGTDGMHHLYVDVVRWQGNDGLVLRVHGHGNGRSVDRHVLVGPSR